MTSYVHNGTGAIVYIAPDGVKTIVKHGIQFHSFIELSVYEKKNKESFKKKDPFVLQKGDLDSIDRKRLREEWFRTKGE